jgi:thiol-disulfide isomerase/thioredoxin
VPHIHQWVERDLIQLLSGVVLKRLNSIAAMLLVVLAAATGSAGRSIGNGKFTGLDGTPHTLAEDRGHVTVVNLWATWCGPCKAEMPLLDTLAKEYAARNVAFVAISIDDAKSQPKIAAFVSQLKVEMPVWKGATTDDLQSWSGDGIVPATLILDADGNIVARLIGQARENEVRERIDWILGGKQGKKPKTPVKHL